MPESKLLGRLPDGRSRSAAGYELAGLLALAAQGVEERDLPTTPSWRALPFEGPFIVGDQLGVTGYDLLAAYARLGSDSASVWAPPGSHSLPERADVGEVLARALSAAEELAGAL